MVARCDAINDPVPNAKYLLELRLLDRKIPLQVQCRGETRVENHVARRHTARVGRAALCENVTGHVAPPAVESHDLPARQRRDPLHLASACEQDVIRVRLAQNPASELGGVLPPSSVGEMTLRFYGALSYSQNSARDLRCA